MRDVVCRLAGLRRIEMAAIAELVVMGSRNEAASPGKQQTNKCSAEYEPWNVLTNIVKLGMCSTIIPIIYGIISLHCCAHFDAPAYSFCPYSAPFVSLAHVQIL